MDALAQDLDAVRGSARRAHTANVAHVDDILARLARARTALAGPEHLDPDNEEPSSSPRAASLGDHVLPLSTYLKTSNADSAAAHRDWAAALSRLAKTADKRLGPPPPSLFSAPPPPSPPTAAAVASLHPHLAALAPATGPVGDSALESEPAPFSSPDVVVALHHTLALHLARLGAFAALDAFLAETPSPPPPQLTPALLDHLRHLHTLLAQLQAGSCTPALKWLALQPADADPLRDLEYALRKQQYIHLVLAAAAATTAAAAETQPNPPSDPRPGPGPSSLARRKSSLASLASLASASGSTSARNPLPPPSPRIRAALEYGGTHFRRLLTPARVPEVGQLLAAPLFLSRVGGSSSSSSSSSDDEGAPYAALFSPAARTRATSALVTTFSATFLERVHHLASASPLTVVTDVGGSGALAKLLKVRAVMREKKTEWSAVGELPVEIPLPASYSFHSVFACPVSKEQSTPANPPMLLPCGHVIARESLHRLARGTPTLKCPYCPVVSHTSACVRVHF